MRLLRMCLALTVVAYGLVLAFSLGSFGTASGSAYEYQQGHLIVVKHVIDDDGGTASASDFTMTIGGVVATGGNSFPGSESGTDKVVSTGGYSVSEAGPAGYLSSFSSGCSGTISAGQTVTCTVTNNDTHTPLDLVTLCFRHKTIVVQQKFVARLLAQGATLGPC
jgi:hypothetical protein